MITKEGFLRPWVQTHLTFNFDPPVTEFLEPCVKAIMRVNEGGTFKRVTLTPGGKRVNVVKVIEAFDLWRFLDSDILEALSKSGHS